ncbi:MAG: hypothetical protein KC912_24795 [Proteobacteria bacterium]|nr:hypothetical protein [Pseudomonadota bacterium]
MRHFVLAIVIGAGVSACGGEVSPAQVRGGSYQFFTVRAEDACLDGAMEALFMPGGRDERHAFEFPIPVPSWDDTPQSYDVDFRAPFLGMPVTVEATEEGYAIRGSVMDAVELDTSSYGDCVATMQVDADLQPDTATLLYGEARIDVSNPRGDDERCPVFADDPCRVRLDIEAEWLSD